MTMSVAGYMEDSSNRIAPMPAEESQLPMTLYRTKCIGIRLIDFFALRFGQASAFRFWQPDLPHTAFSRFAGTKQPNPDTLRLAAPSLQYLLFDWEGMGTTEGHMQKRSKKIASLAVVALGLALLVMMILVEDEFGALPLALIVGGGAWYGSLWLRGRQDNGQ